jgi:hypothetical protein
MIGQTVSRYRIIENLGDGRGVHSFQRLYKNEPSNPRLTSSEAVVSYGGSIGLDSGWRR